MGWMLTCLLVLKPLTASSKGRDSRIYMGPTRGGSFFFVLLPSSSVPISAREPVPDLELA